MFSKADQEMMKGLFGDDFEQPTRSEEVEAFYKTVDDTIELTETLNEIFHKDGDKAKNATEALFTAVLFVASALHLHGSMQARQLDRISQLLEEQGERSKEALEIALQAREETRGIVEAVGKELEKNS